MPAAARPLLAALLLGAAGLLAACVPGVPPAPGKDASAFRLPALHAAPDPVNGGRILDAGGREVLLRGVNVNAYADYWAYSPSLFVAYPITADDADRMAAIGWNCVRLLLSWSRVEPQPGEECPPGSQPAAGGAGFVVGLVRGGDWSLRITPQ